LKRKRAALEQQIAGLRSDYETAEVELRRIDEQAGARTRVLTDERKELARLRQADAQVTAGPRGSFQPKQRK
jgi:circadian clock protein KaiC